MAYCLCTLRIENFEKVNAEINLHSCPKFENLKWAPLLETGNCFATEPSILLRYNVGPLTQRFRQNHSISHAYS